MEYPVGGRWALIVCLGLSLLVSFVYWQVGHHGFIPLDDFDYVEKNLHVKDGLTSQGVAWAFTTTHMSNWHPVTWLSHMLDVELFGTDPRGHHMVNLALHLLNSLLLFHVLLVLTRSLWKSAFVAVMFAVHPLHVESVAWISERKDLLCCLFSLLAIRSYAEYARRGAILWSGIVTLFLALALMSKPMAVTLPFVFLLLDYWPLARLGPEDGAAGVARRILEKAPMFALSATSCIVTYFAQKSGGTVNSLHLLPLDARLANALVSYGSYLWKTIWPAKLSVFYPHPWDSGGMPAWSVLAAAIVLSFITAAAWRQRLRHLFFPVGWFWYLGSLVPVIGLVQVGLQGMADRYTYFPLVGIFMVIAWGAPGVLPDFRHKRIALALAGIASITAAVWVARLQVSHWRDSESLFRHALQVTPDNPVAHSSLGVAYFEEGRTEDAFAEYIAALRLRPDFDETYHNLGILYMKGGRVREAVECFRAVYRLNPDFPDIGLNLGTALTLLGAKEEAVLHLRRAVRMEPDWARAHYNLAVALADTGRLDEAIRHYREVIRIRPRDSRAHNNLGDLLLRQGRVETALVQFRESLRWDPADPVARGNLEKAMRSRKPDR